MPRTRHRAHRVLLALALLAMGLPTPARGASPRAPLVQRPAKGRGPLSPRLTALVAGAQRGIATLTSTALPETGPGSLLVDRAGMPLVYLTMRSVGPAAQVALSDAGARIVHTSQAYRVITASVAPRDLERVAAVPGVP